MINVSELVIDPDFCQKITVTRTKLTTVNHEVVRSFSTFTIVGVITIANDSSSKLLPEANRQDEDVHVYSNVLLYNTGTYKGIDYEADKISFNGENYLVQASLNDLQYGFCRATATKEKQR